MTLKKSKKFVDFEQVRKINSHFAAFEQVKNLPNSKTPLRETGCLSNILGYLSMSPALHPGFSDLWRSVLALSSTPTAFGYLLFLIVQASSFLIHSLSLTQSVRLPLGTYHSLCSTCVSYRTPCHASGHQVLPTQSLPREVEGFLRGERYFKHVPPLTYLIYLSPKEVYW